MQACCNSGMLGCGIPMGRFASQWSLAPGMRLGMHPRCSGKKKDLRRSLKLIPSASQVHFEYILLLCLPACLALSHQACQSSPQAHLRSIPIFLAHPSGIPDYFWRIPLASQGHSIPQNLWRIPVKCQLHFVSNFLIASQ